MARVLVIDDDPSICKLVAHFLTQEAHEVRTLDRGSEGIETARAFRPDVMVVDWMMPDLSGLDVTRHLRADSELGNIYLILLTARDHLTNVQDGYAAGADDYLVKPFRPSELAARIAEASSFQYSHSQ